MCSSGIVQWQYRCYVKRLYIEGWWFEHIWLKLYNVSSRSEAGMYVFHFTYLYILFSSHKCSQGSVHKLDVLL